jgi:hypothetical protein
MKKCLGLVVVGVLLAGSIGCTYNGHTNMGDTEKWVASDVNIVPKVILMIPITIFDSVFSPFTAGYDQIFRDPQYHEAHRYLSYAGSRTIGRSDMGFGYQVVASIFSIPIETVWLLVTGPVDLITVLVSDEDGTDDSGLD